jgi:hypothetical protein
MSKSESTKSVIRRALIDLHSGVGHGSKPRNRFLLTIQPVVRKIVRTVTGYVEGPLRDEEEDIISIVNCIILGRVFNRIRHMGSTFDWKKVGDRLVKDQKDHEITGRSVTAVKRLLDKTIRGTALNYLKRRTRDRVEITHNKDLGTVIQERVSANHKIPWFEADKTIVKRAIEVATKRHMRFKAYPRDGIRELVHRMIVVMMRDTYTKTGGLVMKTIDADKGISQQEAIVLLLTDWMDLDPTLLELYCVAGPDSFLKILEVFSGRTLKFPSVKDVRKAYESIELYQRVEKMRKLGKAKWACLDEVSASYDFGDFAAWERYNTVEEMLQFLKTAIEDLKGMDLDV